MKPADRLQHIEPFYVMECAKAAGEIARGPLCDPARGGRPMIYLNIGEPDFTAPEAVRAAAGRAIAEGRTQYTDARGLPELRRAISAWYGGRFDVDLDPDRIVVTAGASAALQLACSALVSPGDQVLMPDPTYPCNRHFVAAVDGEAVLLPTTAADRFQLPLQAVQQAWGGRTRGLCVASPSNPTGTSIAPEVMAGLVDFAREREGFALIDEIYLGLSYDAAYGRTALALPGADEAVVSVNSFSKYFCMTGWRLGWLVLPEAMVEPVERLAQNLYICASAVAQRAALAAFDPESLAECEARRQAFRERRDFIVPTLEALGLSVPVAPDGAFYVWIDISRHSRDSWDFTFRMMREAQVALTPGRDFARLGAERFVRLSFARSMDELREAVDRIGRVLARDRANAAVA